MNLDLTDKVAIVTGSSRGLGLATATALLAEGCRVTICARGAEQLRRAAADLACFAPGGERSRIFPVVADVSTAAGVDEVVGSTVKTFGGLDILVNNVGLARGSTITDTTDAE